MQSSSSADETTSLAKQKRAQRRCAYDALKAQPHKDELSEVAVARLIAQPEYQAARTVLWYLHCRSELRTQRTVRDELHSHRRIVVPYCTSDAEGEPMLGLWRLENMQELTPGMWHILEPPPPRRSDPARQIQAAELDAVVVPGVAFSRNGGRLGNGQGYYDRLLALLRRDCVTLGLCFECQMMDDLATGPYDVWMDRVITEQAVYRGRRPT